MELKLVKGAGESVEVSRDSEKMTGGEDGLGGPRGLKDPGVGH